MSLPLVLGKPGVMLGGLPCSVRPVEHSARAAWMLKNADACGGMPRVPVFAEESSGERGGDGGGDSSKGPKGERREQNCWVCSSGGGDAPLPAVAAGMIEWRALVASVVVPADVVIDARVFEPRRSRGPPSGLIA